MWIIFYGHECLFEIRLSIILGLCPKVELLGHMAIIFLIYSGRHPLVSMLTSRWQMFQFVYMLAQPCYFLLFKKKNRFPVLQKRSSQDCLHNSVSVRNTACLRAQLSRCVWPFVTLRTVAHQAPQSMALSTLDCSGLHALLQGILSNQGIRPTASALQADSLLLSHQGSLSLTLVNCKIQSGYGGKFLCYVHLTTIFKN